MLLFLGKVNNNFLITEASMKNKQLTLFFSVLLASSAAFSQPIQFSNGDILEVELIFQTDETLTFLHPALGEQTINKVKISNLQNINLQSVPKLTEAGIKGHEKVKMAEAKVLEAKDKVNAAEVELIAAKVVFDKTGEVNRTDAEEKLILAEKKFSAAKEEVRVAQNELKVTRDVIVAEARLLDAQAKVDIAKADVAKVGGKSIAEELGIVAVNATVELAEEKVNAAEQQVAAAEDNLKLAKGEKVNVGFMGTGWFKGWDSRFDLGMNGSSGPSENFNFRAGFAAGYADNEGKWDFKSYYLTNSQDSESTTNKANATLLKDWFFKETKWFSFGSLTYDWDENKDWRHRVQISGGPGYQFIKNDVWTLSGKMGGTGVFEFGGNEAVPGTDPVSYAARDNAQDFEIMAGADLLWNISEEEVFTLSNYIYSRATDAGKIRNVTNIAWQHDLDFFKGLAMKFHIHNEYDMTQVEEKNKNDLQYGVLLALGF